MSIPACVFIFTYPRLMKKIFFLIGLTSTMISCEKNDEQISAATEDIAGTYKLVGLTMGSTTVPEQDAMSSLFDCEKDDLYKLNADSSFQYIDAGVACEPNGNFTGNWELNGNVISFYGESGNITKFDGTILEVTTSSTISGTTYTKRSTYKKQ